MPIARRSVIPFVVLAMFSMWVAAAANAGDAPGHELAFRPVLLDVPVAAEDPAVTSTEAIDAVLSCDPSAVIDLIGSGVEIPTTAPPDDDADACVVLEQRGAPERLLLGPTELTGKAVKAVEVEFWAGDGWSVAIRFTKQGGEQFDALGEAHLHERVAIVVDGVAQSAPTIQPNNSAFASFDATAVISGDFTKREAKLLAKAVRLAK